MSLLSSILRNAEGGRLTWWCPGCDSPHQVAVTGEHVIGGYTNTDGDVVPRQVVAPPPQGDGIPRWGWNGDAVRPTFTPSVLVSYDGADAGKDGAPPKVCHSFVVDGGMQFLSDCTHALAGQTVAIPAWPRPEWQDG